MAKIEYQRLTRNRSRFSVAVLSRTSLWLGSDHLLYVESNGYTETYKRFYFRDIQAFTVQKTPVARTVNIIFAVVTLLFLLFGLLSETPGLKIFLFVLAGLCGLILLFNAAPGASCKCYVRTAVQTEELSALARLPRTRKVLDRIRPIITAAQGGELPPETLPNLLREMEQVPADPPASQPAAEVLPGVPPRLEP